MKTMTLTLTGTQKYWAHAALISLIQERTHWDESRIKSFLSSNPSVNFNQQTPEDIRRVLDELERAGFQLELVEKSGGITAALDIPESRVLNEIKTQLKEIREEPLYAIQEQLRQISERIGKLETRQGAQVSGKTIEDHPVYQKLIARGWAEKDSPITDHQPVRTVPQVEQSAPSFATEEKRTMTEADIGKYWLSRIGILTLLMGIVFLITYTSQFLGAWGKLAIGAALGALLVGIGNFLSSKENYHKWAMSAIGGGWAILYFTVFAAYHVPLVKVIQNPFVDVVLLLGVSTASILQSLKFKSRVLVFMSYFLAYFAAVSTAITPFTLLASFLLAISIVLVTRKLGWNWLAALGMLAVYVIHWLWLAPSLDGTAGGSFSGVERVAEMIVLPWTGNSWRIYPLLDAQKSVLHLLFLLLYWSLFSIMSLFRSKEQEQANLRDMITLSVTNNLIFTLSVMHHLHVYYPGFKWMFSLGMAIVFLAWSYREHKKGQNILSDINLVFFVSLACLTVPISLKGASITCGWAAAMVSLFWLGLQHGRTVLRSLGTVLGVVVLLRLVLFDYLDRTALVQWGMPVSPFMLTALFSAGAYFLVSCLYERNQNILAEEKLAATSTALIMTAATFSIAFLMGGFRPVASVILMGAGAALMKEGLLKDRSSLRVASWIFVVLSAFRLMSVDCGFPLGQLLSNANVLFHYTSAILSAGILLSLADYVRQSLTAHRREKWFFPALSLLSAVIYMFIVSDTTLDAWRSLIWGLAAFLFMMSGFWLKTRIYRWIGLGMFGFVVGRLLIYDLAQLDLIFRIISFIGLGAVFIVASFIYNYYSKMLLDHNE
jgi:uncharacterized membrane protein